MWTIAASECAGFGVPALRLVASSVHCLHVPFPMWSPQERGLLDHFESEIARQGGRLAIAEGHRPAALRRAAREAKRAGVLREAMLDAKLREDWRLHQLRLTHKVVLGVTIASRMADVVVFSTSGLDPLGCERVLALARRMATLTKCAAVHLSGPTSPERICDPRGLCVELISLT